MNTVEILEHVRSKEHVFEIRPFWRLFYTDQMGRDYRKAVALLFSGHLGMNPLGRLYVKPKGVFVIMAEEERRQFESALATILKYARDGNDPTARITNSILMNKAIAAHRRYFKNTAYYQTRHYKFMREVDTPVPDLNERAVQRRALLISQGLSDQAVRRDG